MPKIPRIWLVFAIALAMFVFLPKKGANLGIPGSETIVDKAADLREVSFAILTGLVLLWVFDETLKEHLRPVLKDGLEQFAQQIGDTVEKSLAHMGNTLAVGFDDLPPLSRRKSGNFQRR